MNARTLPIPGRYPAPPDKLVIGIPRALLYHRYAVLWKTFFSELGAQVVLSPATNRTILENGSALITDESCLSAKIFFGHLQTLVGRCDYILVPRIANRGRNREFCVRFSALYDMARSIFRQTDQRFLAYNLDVLAGWEEESAFLQMGQSLGYPYKAVRRAYDTAKREEQRTFKAQVRAQERLYKAEGIKILILGHSYLVRDAFFGKSLIDTLRKMEVIPLRADLVDREAARRAARELLPTCKWEMNRELVGGMLLHKNQVDGVILLSAFPCGPDAMVNEMLLRRCKGIPILQLVLDGQSGTAGIETRLESFVDIIRLKEGKL